MKKFAVSDIRSVLGDIGVCGFEEMKDEELLNTHFCFLEMDSLDFQDFLSYIEQNYGIFVGEKVDFLDEVSVLLDKINEELSKKL